MLRIVSVLSIAALAGCTTSSLEDAASGIRDTNTFPNLNVPMQAETAQLTQAESAQGVAALQAARARHRAETTAAAAAGRGNAADLQRLRQSHAADALRIIEAETDEEE